LQEKSTESNKFFLLIFGNLSLSFVKIIFGKKESYSGIFADEFSVAEYEQKRCSYSSSSSIVADGMAFTANLTFGKCVVCNSFLHILMII
jgi:hypothetical protein